MSVAGEGEVTLEGVRRFCGWGMLFLGRAFSVHFSILCVPDSKLLRRIAHTATHLKHAPEQRSVVRPFPVLISNK